MSRLITAAALAGVAWAGAASAQDFKGMEFSAEVLSFTDDGDIAQTTYRGSLEFGVMGTFGVAADLSFYDFGGDDGVSDFTLHALYDALAFATVGGFYARENYDGGATDSFGIEAGRSFGTAGVEGYLGFAEDEVDGSFRFAGLDATYDVTQNISVKGSAALIDGDGVASNRLSVGGEYRFGDGPALYAEIGRLELDVDTLGDASETFIGLGARIAIGPNRGTTFESRGLTEAFSGF